MELCGLLIAIAAGTVAGLTARAVMPRTEVGGWIGDVIVGIFGATFGAFLVYSLSIGHTMYAPSLWYGVVGLSVAAGFLLTVRASGFDAADPTEPD